VSDLFGVAGRELLAAAALDGAYRGRVDSLCRLIDAVDFEIDALASPLRARLARHRGYTAIQAIPGVGPVLAAVFVAEIGEVDRFTDPAQLAFGHPPQPSGRPRRSALSWPRRSVTPSSSPKTC